MTGPGYFDELFAGSDDPWGHVTSAYEQHKYAMTVDALTEQRYTRAFEPGCGVGVLTAMLAGRCDLLHSWDGAPRAVALTRSRVPAAHVRVEQGRVPGEWPEGRFDLIVCSELLYFLDSTDREAFRARVIGSLAPGGTLLAVHWRHPFAEAPTHGNQVHAELDADPRLRTEHRHVADDFVLQRFSTSRR